MDGHVVENSGADGAIQADHFIVKVGDARPLPEPSKSPGRRHAGAGFPSVLNATASRES